MAVNVRYITFLLWVGDKIVKASYPASTDSQTNTGIVHVFTVLFHDETSGNVE